MEYQPWLEETSEGDRDPGASHAYAVAEASAKAAGSAPTGEVSCSRVSPSSCTQGFQASLPACLPIDILSKPEARASIVMAISLPAAPRASGKLMFLKASHACLAFAWCKCSESEARLMGLLPLQIRLIAPGQWQQAVWREALQQGETPCSLTSQLVRNTETDAMQTYLVAGTAYLLGEDCPCTGRVILYQVAREEGQWQGKLVCFRCASMMEYPL